MAEKKKSTANSSVIKPARATKPTTASTKAPAAKKAVAPKPTPKPAMKPLAAAVQQITSWSFSRYAVYKLCPQKAKFKFILKIPEPGNKAMERGDQIHKMAEGYIKGTITRLPAELKLFGPELKMHRTQYKKKINGMHVEDSWSYRKDWSETVWNDWVNCWLRVKLDLGYHEDEDTYIITDWKTGQYRPDDQQDYIEQLELYALAVFLKLPHIKMVKPRLAYIDHGITFPPANAPMIFARSDLPKLMRTWEKRVRPMMSDKRFAPRANSKCKWCHYRNGNAADGGGQCKF